MSRTPSSGTENEYFSNPYWWKKPQRHCLHIILQQVTVIKMYCKNFTSMFYCPVCPWTEEKVKWDLIWNYLSRVKEIYSRHLILHCYISMLKSAPLTCTWWNYLAIINYNTLINYLRFQTVRVCINITKNAIRNFSTLWVTLNLLKNLSRRCQQPLQH